MGIINETVSDGVGLRMSLYLSGCRHKCVGCHNRQSWNPNNGDIFDERMFQSVIAQYKSNPLLSGITLTGGDPLYDFDAFTILIKKLKHALACNIWVYTGYEYEKIAQKPFMQYIDVLVDGKFIQKLYAPDLTFKGSRNQRIIDVQKSQKKGRIVTLFDS